MKLKQVAAYYVGNSGVLATCDSSFGPAGDVRCDKYSDYYDYQWAICRTNTYIQTKSKNKHICVNSTRIYCYYHCMLDEYHQNDGFVFSDCRCSPDDPLPTESVPLQSWCYSPDGKNCSWYKECLSKAYPQCENNGDDYGIKFEEKFCNLCNESNSTFSFQEQRWIDATRICLQLQLVPLVDRTREKTCAELKSTAFESHSPCYLNPDKSSLSYCNLSLSDRLKVFWTIKSFFPEAIVPGLNGLLEAMTACTPAAVRSYAYNTKAKIKKAVSEITARENKTKDVIIEETKMRIRTWLEDTVSPIPIQLEVVVHSVDLPKFFINRRKRSLSIDKDVAKSEFAEKFLDDLTLKENWQEKGVVWFGYAKEGTGTAEKTISIRLVVEDRYKYEHGVNTSLSETKPVNITTALVELSEAVVNETLDLWVDGESVTITKLNGCLDWNCKEYAFNITVLQESNRAAMYGAMYTLTLAFLVINIMFIPM